jgi:hypothetical protein
MDLAIQGGMSPDAIIAFVQEHTEEYSAMVMTEMQDAKERTQLMKDIGDLTTVLTRSKPVKDDDDGNRKKFNDAQTALAAFHKKYPDFSLALDGATQAMANFAAASDNKGHLDVDSASEDMDRLINNLTNVKDKVSGDDKISMMNLQEDASNVKDLYELGSNLLAKLDQSGSVLISNIKG